MVVVVVGLSATAKRRQVVGGIGEVVAEFARVRVQQVAQEENTTGSGASAGIAPGIVLLLQAVERIVAVSEASATPTVGGVAQQMLGNPGFETGSAAPWVGSSGIIDNGTGEAAHAGSWKAWLNGYGSTHTDTLYQTVTIPSTITTATLSFYLHIDTAETTTTSAYDTLKVQVRNSAGTVLTTLATYSNLNKAAGYTQKTFNLLPYKGTTIQIYLIGSEDSSLQTSFVLDDFALYVR